MRVLIVCCLRHHMSTNFIIADLYSSRDVDNTSSDVRQERLDEVRVHLDRHVHNIKYHHEKGDGEAH